MMQIGKTIDAGLVSLGDGQHLLSRSRQCVEYKGSKEESQAGTESQNWVVTVKCDLALDAQAWLTHAQLDHCQVSVAR